MQPVSVLMAVVFAKAVPLLIKCTGRYVHNSCINACDKMPSVRLT